MGTAVRSKNWGSDLKTPSKGMAALSGAHGSKQIQQMVNFILQEAHEKANEIQVRTEHDFDLEIQTAVVNGKHKINAEMEQKRRDREVADRISRSKSITTARTEIMEARQKLMVDLNEDIKQKIMAYPGNSNYPELIKDLLIQAFQTLYDEKCVEIICRHEDKGIVEQKIGEAERDFNKVVGPDKLFKVTISCTMNTTLEHLPSEPMIGTPSGPGIVVIAKNGGIVCDNTLMTYVWNLLNIFSSRQQNYSHSASSLSHSFLSRLTTATRECLPIIRRKLFEAK